MGSVAGLHPRFARHDGTVDDFMKRRQVMLDLKKGEQ